MIASVHLSTVTGEDLLAVQANDSIHTSLSRSVSTALTSLVIKHVRPPTHFAPAL